MKEARVVLDRLLRIADERGEAYSYALFRLHLFQLELRIGDCRAAGRLLEEWAQSSDPLMWPMYERCQALFAASRGLADEAEHWAEKTIAQAERTSARWDWLEARRAVGSADLLRNEHEDDVGPELPGTRERLVAVDRLADHLHGTVAREDRLETGAHQRVVVDEQHADRRVAHDTSRYGSVARTLKLPSSGPASSVPSTRAARSRMPTIP